MKKMAWGSLEHLLVVALPLFGFSVDDSGGWNRPTVYAQSGSLVDGTFTDRANVLHGGESPQEVKKRLGTPQIERLSCSKDFACKRKYYLLQYCFSSASDGQCNSYAKFRFNKPSDSDGFLFEISSNIREIRSREFASYAPDWWVSPKKNGGQVRRETGEE